MKYENFEEVSKICKKLDKLIDLKQKLAKEPTVAIWSGDTYVIRVDCGGFYEPEYTDLAQGFIDTMLSRIDGIIDELKNDLATL